MAMKWCEDQNVKIINDLGNAIDMNKKFPTLHIPNYMMIAAIQPDDSVGLTHEGERFWVKVDYIEEIDENHWEFIGKVTDDLQFPHSFQTGDCIVFNGSNILNIISREWKNKLRISPNE